MKLILPALILMATSVQAQTGTRFTWEYSQALIATHSIIRFELEIDGGGWVDVGMNLLDPINPDTYFTPIPPTILGTQHTAEIRACNATVCSTPEISYTITAVQTPSEIVNSIPAVLR